MARRSSSARSRRAMQRGFVVVTVLAFNFMGDGLRDAADPYK